MEDEKKLDIIETHPHFDDLTSDEIDPAPSYSDESYPEPTEEEWKELPEVADTIPKAAFLVILIEFCERFTYYGLSGPFQNYIQHPDPPSCKC
jgi:POT family proton-dependent oligopeptide transporter